MRILVTGGGGFIGVFLVRALLNQGDTVVVFDVAPQPACLMGIPEVTYVRGDCGAEIDLRKAVCVHKIDGIFHCGALMGGEPSESNPLEAFRVNFHSTQILLDAAVTFGVRRFFFMSSISIYDPRQPEPVPQDGIMNPPNIYGQTKLASEHLMRWYAKNHGIDARGIRPSWVWGPNRRHGMTALYTAGMLNRIAAGGEVFIENPEERGDWLYIHDCIKAMLMLWNAKAPKERIYTVCGSVHTLREVAEIAAGHCRQATLVFSDEETALSPYAVHFDDTPARRDFGWKPDFTIETAVKDYLSVVLGREV
ncbi:MAG: NAD(P)-dependent oxidoreductase [Desulfovibrio sp.]|jgi:nucleoside-diphosphate-sugar epimerase|nr:NAD(P)-dependent oxidoreductase [Desulfovibrio sp.]